jgi:hypothetical protein
VTGDAWQQYLLNNANLAQGNAYGAINTGQGIAAETAADAANYGVTGTNYEQQADQAYQQLAQTPGYTDAQAAGIEGNPQAGFEYYNPSGLTGTVQQGNQAVTGAAGDYQSDLGGQVGSLQSGLQGNVSDLNTNLNAATQGLQSGVTGTAAQAAQGIQGVAGQQLGYQGGVYNYLQGQGQQQTAGLNTGLNQAVGEYGGAIQSDIDPSKLTVGSDFTNEYEMSPEEQQNVKDVASQTTAGQFQSMRDQAAMQAAAEGNTSPAAMAAIEKNLGTSGAIAAGQAASSAELAANTEAANRQLTNEQLTLGANQALTNTQLGQAANLYGAQSGTANTEYSAAAQQAQNLGATEMSGINTAEGTNLAAQQAAGNLQYGAAQTAGQAGINTAATEGQTALGATEYGGSAGIGATEAADTANIGAQQYGATAATSANEYNQNAGENLAVGANQAATAGATTVANQAIAGRTQGLNYLTGQQSQAQGQQAGYTNAQISNMGTEYGAATGATNAATSAASAGSGNQAANYGTTSKTASGIVSDVFEDGGVVTKPTVGIVGERGPEMVVPLSRNGISKEAVRKRRYRGPETLAA